MEHEYHELANSTNRENTLNKRPNIYSCNSFISVIRVLFYEVIND